MELKTKIETTQDIYKALGIDNKVLDREQIEFLLVSILLLVQPEDLDKVKRHIKSFMDTQELVRYRYSKGVRQ
jgi:hypothetical protein